MQELVKYKNEMNAVKFTDFTAAELNMLMALCSKMRDQETNKVRFDLTELKQLTGYESKDRERFIADLERMNRKLAKATGRLEVGSKIILFVLFTTFTIDRDDLSLEIAVNPEFKFILNEITANFTQFELAEFVKLKTKHSKNLYRLLKQFRSTGLFRIKLEDFREKMDCQSYEVKFIRRYIINPAVKELQDYFPGLNCKSICSHKQGAPVIGYEFTFQHDEEVIEGQISLFDMQPKKKKQGFTDFDQREFDSGIEEALLNAGRKK